MTDREPEEVDSDEEYEAEPPATTPFDNPYFLPVMLWAFTMWFGFDIVTDAEAYQEWPQFNIGGLVVCGSAAIWFTRSAIREKRAEREAGPSD